jgi:hypothetical protein
VRSQEHVGHEREYSHLQNPVLSQMVIPRDF